MKDCTTQRFTFSSVLLSHPMEPNSSGPNKMYISICRDVPRNIRTNSVVSVCRDGCTRVQPYIKIHTKILFYL